MPTKKKSGGGKLALKAPIRLYPCTGPHTRRRSLVGVVLGCGRDDPLAHQASIASGRIRTIKPASEQRGP